MEQAELIVAARRTRTRATHQWIATLDHAARAWLGARRLELEQRSRTGALTTASWPWWRT